VNSSRAADADATLIEIEAGVATSEEILAATPSHAKGPASFDPSDLNGPF
jgi:hypothetical protein